MPRLFLHKLIVILTVTFWGLNLNGVPQLQAQEEAAVAIEVAIAEEELEDEDEEDEDDVPAANNMLANWGTSKAKVLGAKKFLLTNIFAVEVEQIMEVCDLDERRMKKLKIASRGAIKKSYEKFKNTGVRQLGIVNFGNADEDSDEEEITPEVYTDADDIDVMTMQVASGMMTNPFKTESPTDSKFWKNALKASLGEEQHQKLMKHRTERDLMKRKKNIISTIETLALELRLSDEKKLEFSELLTPKMLDADAKIGPMYEQFVMYYHASKVSKSKLKKILTKAQLQKWKSAIAPAKQYGQMIDAQNAQNNAGDEEGGDWEETMSFLVEVDRAVDDVVEGVVEFVEGIVGR